MKRIAFRAIHICLLIIDFIFLVFVLKSRDPIEYFNYYYYSLVASAVILGIMLTWSLIKSFSKDISTGINTTFVLTIILSVVHGFVFFMLLPKYSIEDAYKKVKRDSAYVSGLVMKSSYGYSIKGNPFVRSGYVLLWDTIDYRSRSFYIRTSEIQFDQVTGNHKVGHYVESVVNVDSLDGLGMDCVNFEKDKKALINLHFILEPEKVLHGIETSFSYQYFNASYEHIEKNGIMYTTRRRPDMDVSDARDFINDVGKNKLKIQLEKYVRRFYSELGKDLPDPDIIEIKLYGIEIASYQNGGVEMKNLR